MRESATCGGASAGLPESARSSSLALDFVGAGERRDAIDGRQGLRAADGLRRLEAVVWGDLDHAGGDSHRRRWIRQMPWPKVGEFRARGLPRLRARWIGRRNPREQPARRLRQVDATDNRARLKRMVR